MRSPFFPRYSEEDILKRVYSFMARLKVAVDMNTMNSKDFFYHSDTIQHDIIEEKKRAEQEEAMRRAGATRF